MSLGLTSLASVAHTPKQKMLNGSGVKINLVIPNDSLFDLLQFLGAFENSEALLATLKD